MAVWGIIAAQGIEGVTLRAVAREAGVSVGRVQHYYPSREELVRDSCRVMVTLAEESFGQDAGGLPPVQALQELVLHAVPTTAGFTRGTAIWTSYLAKTVDDDGLAELVRDAQRGTVEQVVRWIEEARADGSMSTGADPRHLALELLALSEGYAARVLTGSLTAQEARAALERRLAAEGVGAT